ncbi:hypothetical protein GGR92_004730 [Spirosoma lacussanchae]|uniref:hypothetical protein n=1 Tax=Spirosoma lacussanchae TaxID=1884249 RepID=UPI0011082854|nr:hypothetical protein [Spirosoma lacussanchae]
MKQTITKNFLLVVLALAVVFAFAMKATVFQQSTPASATPAAAPPNPAFAGYWFAGKAELNHYRLQQAQYGVLNPGEAVLIFVTEDFRTDKQVKAETDESRDKAIPVLKTNMSKKFVTGIYDYSLFTSVFTPINNPSFPNTLKVSTSAQEWCGHSYLQANYRNNGYAISGKSYFEKEVDEAYTIDKVWFEDELWNRIRLNPDKLPTGEVRLVPGTMTARLRHTTLEPLLAKAQIDDYEGVLYPGRLLRAYTIQYPTDDRTLIIVFESTFPHKIVGWEETYRSKDALLTSRAVLTKTIQNDYWKHNAPADSTLRAELMK